MGIIGYLRYFRDSFRHGRIVKQVAMTVVSALGLLRFLFKEVLKITTKGIPQMASVPQWLIWRKSGKCGVSLSKRTRACGAMDNASDYGSEDSRFDSWQARITFIRLELIFSSCIGLNERPIINKHRQKLKFWRLGLRLKNVTNIGLHNLKCWKRWFVCCSI